MQRKANSILRQRQTSLLYIPPTKKLREQLLNDNHNAPIAGHLGVFKTYELINHYYWWPSQLKDVKAYVKGCFTCQQNKASRQKKATLLNPHTPPELPWESISLDIIGPLPESNGFNAILSVIDHFSKVIHLIPTTTELSTKGLINIYLKQIWKLHCYDARSQYFPRSVTACRFLFFLSFPLDYIIDPQMAQPPTRLRFVSFLSFYSFYYGLIVIAQQSSRI